MPEYPITPVAITRYDTISQRSELLDGPAAAPYRFNWRAVHGAQLAQDFKLALKKLEGLMYVLWGGQPDYAGQQQWYTREHPRCRWGAEQWWEQPSDTPPPDAFWNYLETAALGAVKRGAVPSVPVRSRSGDPGAQFKRSQHSVYFPLGSVQRYCGSPGSTGHQVHDPASTYKQFSAWPSAEQVIIRYVPPPAVTSVEWLAVITSHDLYTMSEVEPGIWEATIPARTQDDFVWWFVLGNFNGQSGNHHDPFVGVDGGGDELEPQRRGRLDDSEHVGSSVTQRHADDAYYFTFFSHYNPYAHGLPELLDENEPGASGNWLRKGTDGYRFDSSENIQPGLINLARFVLDHIGSLVNHSPSGRGGAELCCPDMPIHWRWSGANRPDLYRDGGKDGSSPLHNHPGELNAGSADARKSWRGIEMAFRNAGDVPGFFPNNIWYGDTESWLIWLDRLTLEPDPLNPPFDALIRDYGDRGLRAEDAIDPVHLLEIIAAVDYLISNGLWVRVPIHTAPRTPAPDDVWGGPCGNVHYAGSTTFHDPDDQEFNEAHDYSEIDVNGLCCAEVLPGPDCVPFARPTWAECTGSGKCFIGRSFLKQCNVYAHYETLNQIEWITCNAANQNGFFSIYVLFGGHEYGGWIDNEWFINGGDCHDENCPGEGTESAQYGASYFLCGPDQSRFGPVGDNLHGNGYMKDRYDPDGNYSVPPNTSMGNRFATGSVTACATPGIDEPTPDFQTVVGVVDQGNAGAWYKYDTCTVGGTPSYSAPPPIPGLGLWDCTNTSPLYTLFSDASTQDLNAHVGIDDYCGCDPNSVWVKVDLNLQSGIPTLYDYDLGVEDPSDDCPCKTWTGPEECL